MKTFPLFANPATSVREARAWAIGANWYFNRAVKIQAQFETHRTRAVLPREIVIPPRDPDALPGRVLARLTSKPQDFTSLEQQ